MKIFRFIANNINDEQTFYHRMGIATIPDTALLIRQRPFFLPDFCEDSCMAQLCLCVRIDRLGRSIAERFAHRYYNAQALTLGVHFVARALFEQLQAEKLPIDRAIGFDNAVAIAEKSAIIEGENLLCEIKHNDQLHTLQVGLEQMQKVIDAEIARISLFYTLRQGDFLLIPLSLEEFRVAIADHLSLALNGETILSFDIK